MQMSANEMPLTTKTISDLLQYSFFIPSYQRGYRWTKQQVEDILNDIAEFSPKEIKDSNDKTWYCLQPIVVKDRDGKWDVIDGQQRLTTIYLILKYLNLKCPENERKKLFTLQYETRTGSEDYLKTLSENSIDDSNIDYYFISFAYKNIATWFKSKGQDFVKGFKCKFLCFTKVIWYETAVNDSIDIFTRINSGKIPLTNSELIKALFLNSSNFKDSDQEKIRLKQLEIASEWDKIEYTLQNSAFWYFLNKEKNSLPTRIEFILNLIADKPSNADEFYTFRHFNEKFKQYTEKEIAGNWQEIKKYYQVLEEWFTDRELYHKIGFLIATGTNIKDIIKLKKKLSKTELKKSINSKIKDKVKDVQIVNLEYGHRDIRNLLLLHNIQTMLNNTNETNRFPFDRYKKESWDVEHITAIAEDMPTTELHQKDWLKETLVFIKDKKLKRRASDYKKEDFEQIYAEILYHFNNNKVHEDINDISNLVLLDASTNRSYKNAVFAVKRNTIIERDKKGTFTPVCTKNVFMKLYSNDVSQMTFWGESDRTAYSKDIISTLKIYLPKQIKSKNE
jgi:Protein of unknown function DUF262